ncbi:hypothetical protein ACFQZ4_46870 [Catellatospora coxensis]|uniref:hypothetical protein n=1 Tax=Catellatospora coxensis TaxID=310354 RepID=UPI0019413A45|nr:hypothetical protein [Catellatospora coxensis]
MDVWQELTAEQYAVMVNATEEAYLSGVIYDHNFHTNAVPTGTGLVAPPISEEMVRFLIPRFADVVADLIERGWIEIREPHDGEWNSAGPMTDEEVAAALADPDTWLWHEQRANRLIMLMTTSTWDDMAKRS